MRSTRARYESTGPALLPILAAPVCLLGGLIVILAVLDRQARANADAQAETPPAPAPSDDIELQREELDWRVEQLAASHTKTAADLESERLKLSHIEDHIRRLREEMNRMADAAEHLEKLGGSTAEERARAAADLARLRQRIADAVAELDEARKKTTAPSYAIIPYEGPNRTRRRPIFIECREDMVIIQPEGVELSPADFSGPLGPSNPLASALRAAREHLTRGNAATGEGEPYPLLLVRPGGVAAYYKVREAIESWGSDFGYELIGEEWKLSFPTADPTLADIERRAVEQGRASEIRLAMSAPSRYGRKAPTYRAAPHRGGFIRQDGNGGSGEDGFGSGRHDSQANARGSAHGFERHDDSSTSGSGGSRSDTASANKNESAAGGSGRPAPPSSAAAAAGASGRSPSNSTAGGAASQPGGTGGPAKSGSAAGTTGGPSAGSTGGTSAAGSPQSEFTSQAAKRGENWALPDAARSAVPVTRPVRVLCRADRIAILPEKGETGGKLVMLPGRTDAALDEFVSAMWEHMKGWGIAGNGLYWRPILMVQVGPDGAQRAADLKALLENSGIEYRDPVPSTAKR